MFKVSIKHLVYILQAAKSKYRARVIEQWVMTARECFNLGNFNSLMAIISALNMSPVSRLKKTVNIICNVTEIYFVVG